MDFNPVRKVSVLIGNDAVIAGHEFCDAWAAAGEGSGQEQQQEQGCPEGGRGRGKHELILGEGILAFVPSHLRAYGVEGTGREQILGGLSPGEWI